MKATRAQIDDFLSQPSIAFAGYSVNSKKFGHVVYTTLKEKGYPLYPVNPAGGVTPDGEVIYAGLHDLPDDVKALYIITRPENTSTLVQEALEKGFTHLWVQQMSAGADVKNLLQDHPGAVVGQCILMHTQPTGIHKFHHWLAGLFGQLPK